MNLNRLKVSISILIFFVILNYGFSISDVETDLAWLKGPLILLAVMYFFISFASVATGLIFMTIAMLFSPELGLGVVGSRNIMIRIEDVLIPILVLAWFARSAIHRQLTFVKSPINVPISALLVVSLFSTIQGYAGGWVKPLPAFFYYGKVVEYFLIFFLVINYARNERQIKIFLFFAVITIALMGFYAIAQVPTAEMFTANRVSAPFEDTPQPATAGGYLAFSFLIILSLFLYEKDFIKRWALAGFGLMLLISLFYTFSRTAYAALVVGVIMLAAISKIKWLRFFVVFFLLLSPILLPKDVKNRIAWTWVDAKNPGRTIGVDYSSQERIFAFKRTLWALKINPLFGLGVASWEYPDNQYARSLHEVGLVGLGLWLWIFLRLYRMGRWLHSYLPDGGFKGLALGYSAGVLAILMHGMGSCTFYVIRIMEPFWFMSGLVAALYLLKVQECIAFEEASVA